MENLSIEKCRKYAQCHISQNEKFIYSTSQLDIMSLLFFDKICFHG